MRGFSIVTLLYHSVLKGADSGERYDIRLDAFENHVRRIRDDGLICLAAEDLVSPGASRGGNARGVILSFDDGRIDNYETVFPILEDCGLRGIFFVNPARVGTEGFAGWPQLVEMDRHGMSVQSHGLTHRYLHLLPDAELESELRESREEIRGKTGRDVEFLSLPGGFYSQRVIDAAWRQGYRGVFTSDPGIDRIEGQVRSAVLHRYNITRNTTEREVRDLLERKWGVRIRQGMVNGVKAAARKALGTSLYHRMWSRLAKYSK